MASPHLSDMGRRERNKVDKRERITRVARDLIMRNGISAITTAQVAAAADVGVGTLFLYAKTKGDLLLMVQNAMYSEAFDAGMRTARDITGAVEAITALWTPIIVCNREHRDNGRAYLREVLFGDTDGIHHREAVDLMLGTEIATAELLERRDSRSQESAATIARAISAIVLLTLSNPLTIDVTTDELIGDFAYQVAVLLEATTEVSTA